LRRVDILRWPNLQAAQGYWRILPVRPRVLSRALRSRHLRSTGPGIGERLRRTVTTLAAKRLGASGTTVDSADSDSDDAR
jgi:hypothetical protein